MPIRIMCHTNLDDCKREKWPDLAAQPVRRGDYVRAASGRRLQVVSLTHRRTAPFPPDGELPVPSVEVELHTPHPYRTPGG